MFSTQVRDDVVTLESIGRVRISTVHLKGDGAVRPWEYYETAIGWQNVDRDGLRGMGERGYIVDSNMPSESEAVELHEKLTDAPYLAKLIVSLPVGQLDWY
jgi:hypothetical protein